MNDIHKSNNTDQFNPDVVVVGAGPAGLATAIELGHRGVRCLLIERGATTGSAPRAKMSNVRTRSHLRRWGVAKNLADASPLGIDYPSNITFVTRLGGPGLTRFDHALFCSPTRDDRFPEHSQWIPQYKLEAVLLEHVRSLPSVEIAFEQEFISFTESAESITIHVRNAVSGEERAISAKFLVGADGARSAVRASIGAKMVGQYGLSRNYNIIFEAPGLAEAHGHGPAIQYWQMNRDVPSLLGPMDVGDLWFFMPTGVAADVRYSDEEALNLIRVSTGIDLPYRIVSTDEWVASRLLADRYRSARAFLAGDACHLHPPFGGYGMNMGIADGVDLGWKIAAVLDGWGGPALLDSYETERRPAHDYVMNEAVANHAIAPNQLYRDGIEDASEYGGTIRAEVGDLIQTRKRAEFYGLGVVLGYCFRGSPIIVDDGSQANWSPSRDYNPSATPGCLAPHIWLSDGDSLYDHFGSGFTLLVHPNARRQWVERAMEDVKSGNVPLQIVDLPDAVPVSLYPTALTLVRPDQIVAWRGERWDKAVLSVVSGWLSKDFSDEVDPTSLAQA